MEAKLRELERRLREVDDLSMALAVLRWDQSTYMPVGGGEARGRQIATLGRLIHERLSSDALGELLEDLRPAESGLPPEDWRRDLVRVARRQYQRSSRLPAAFTERMLTNGAASYQAWVEAKPANDFKKVRPYLERTVELSRELASYFPNQGHVADPLIDQADAGMTVATVRAVFDELRRELRPLVDALCSQPAADDSFLQQDFPEDRQLAFGLMVAQRFGYDLERGRMDLTPHPFMIRFASGDVRITTRVRRNNLCDSLFGTLHETGHALYEQGIDPMLDGTLLADGASAGVHESQSRLWENVVGRSRPFWEHFYPMLQEAFPSQLHSVDLNHFHRAINRVKRTLTRVEADEVTYNLHVILRFDLECALLEGSLEVRDLADAWRDRYTSDLGITPPDDRIGVMQDVHWYDGLVGGMFQGYTLGNVLSAQIWESAIEADVSIPEEIRHGRFEPLLAFLRERLYQFGSRKTAPDLIVHATGRPLEIGPYMRYLRGKYGALYAL